MARIRGGKVVGKIGNVVHTGWKGIEVLKTAPHRSMDSWSGKQVMHRQRFKAISEYCNKYKYTLIPQIWNHAAENGHGRNLFVKANSPAFALDGQLAEVDKLHFSAGKLPLPQHLKAERSGTDPTKVEVSWMNDENLSQVYAHDELMMVCAYPDRFTQPIATGALRKSETSLIDLPGNPENITGIWLFFRAYKKDSYSPDQCFGL